MVNHLIHHIFKSSRDSNIGWESMTVLEVISSSKTFLETTLSFLKEFAERKSYSEIRDDYQELVMLIMVNLPSQSSIIHWIASGSFHYTHWIAKLLYAIMIYLFCNRCDQEGPRKHLWYLSILQGKKKLRSIDLHSLVSFFIQWT